MKYYVCFDAYGQPRGAVSENELVETYRNDPRELLRAMCGTGPDAGRDFATGHVGVLNFRNETELMDYLRSLGDEIEGFYACEADSRPYNF